MLTSVSHWLVGLVAFVQSVIAAIEIFLWNIESVHRRLNFDAAEARKMAGVVANAGLYNAFLAGGLIWGLNDASDGHRIEVFFLSCVAIAGLFGAPTLKKWTPLALQTVPAALALYGIRS